MADQLIRDVPPDVRRWIEDERKQRGQSQREFLLSILKGAQENDFAEKAPLLAEIPPEEPATVYVPEHIPFTFVDLFAGIGGLRLALEPVGGRCVFTSEWDKWSQKTYRAWFGETPKGDITKITPADIPDHDILAAGFPCQPFSLAGVSKKNALGRAHGFKCDTQGNLFFNVATIAAIKRPPVLFLENVKNLKSHDKGRTWAVIHDTLDTLGYRVFHKVIDAAAWVPQHRERIYIVCFDKNVFGDNPPFTYPEPPDAPRPRVRDILEEKPDPKYTLTDHLWEYLQAYAKKHQDLGHGFGFGIAPLDGVARTLSARYFKDGSEILIPQEGKNPRRLTPLECARLMGFGNRRVPVSDTQAYRQFGNAVVPKVAEAVAREILKTLAWQLTRSNNGCLIKRRMKKLVTNVTAEQLREDHYGVTLRRAGDRGRNGSGKRNPQIHLPQ